MLSKLGINTVSRAINGGLLGAAAIASASTAPSSQFSTSVITPDDKKQSPEYAVQPYIKGHRSFRADFTIVENPRTEEEIRAIYFKQRPTSYRADFTIVEAQKTQEEYKSYFKDMGVTRSFRAGISSPEGTAESKKWQEKEAAKQKEISTDKSASKS